MIKKPIITEKSIQQTALGKYIFEVDKSANKQQALQEISRLFKVEIIKAAIINVKGKQRFLRRRGGTVVSRCRDRKKIIVTLKKGQTLPGFEIKEEKPAEKPAKKPENKSENKEVSPAKIPSELGGVNKKDGN
ncbi:MAG: large subunit ribosomal protein L23 [Candidatus Berkelbacteria bacterium Licking1014_2]|uniref:Large ribosomal subunit protein uL23 n=1 Tax=Candidatus Berkelbacteria bacterium Licking1014_2 TaxID=2017146 RepID=A0A554LWV6_9BACT|nr:MAG: large subunit ribosomal protein L23 [Candidatus Berkelbacteria bacterium Licking1014_2]